MSKAGRRLLTSARQALAYATGAAATRPPTHPGGILQRQYLDPLGLGVAQAARMLQVSRTTLAQICHERRGITPALAQRLAEGFHTTPALWLNLQRAYDVWQAAHVV